MPAAPEIMETIQFHCPGCGRDFASTYEDCKGPVKCTLCGRVKEIEEMTIVEMATQLKMALENGDAKYDVKVTFEK